MGDSREEDLYIREQVGFLRADVKSLCEKIDAILIRLQDGQAQIRELQEWRSRLSGSIKIGASILAAIGAILLIIFRSRLETFL